MNVEDWIDHIARLSAQFVAGFEVAHGYPPGEHYVRRSTDYRSRDTLAQMLKSSSVDGLIEFYSHATCVSLPDVGSGFFIDDAEGVIGGLRGAQPTRVISEQNRHIVVFGSDGGGALFAIDRQNGEVIRLAGGALLGSDYEVAESGVQVMAQGFPEFLQFIRQELLQRAQEE